MGAIHTKDVLIQNLVDAGKKYEHDIILLDLCIPLREKMNIKIQYLTHTNEFMLTCSINTNEIWKTILNDYIKSYQDGECIHSPSILIARRKTSHIENIPLFIHSMLDFIPEEDTTSSLYIRMHSCDIPIMKAAVAFILTEYPRDDIQLHYDESIFEDVPTLFPEIKCVRDLENLITMLQSGMIEEVHNILDKYTKDVYGHTLMAMAEKYAPSIVHHLHFNLGIERTLPPTVPRDINSERNIALMYARRFLDKDLNVRIGNPGVDERLTLGGKMSFTPLSIFIFHKDLSSIDYALHTGADPNLYVTYTSSTGIIKYISCLQIALFMNQQDIIHKLLSKGGVPVIPQLRPSGGIQHTHFEESSDFKSAMQNTQRYSNNVALEALDSVHINEYLENPDIINDINNPTLNLLPPQWIRTALEMSADPNMPTKYEDMCTYPLQKACERGDFDSLLALIKCGAQVGTQVADLCRQSIWPGESVKCLEFLLDKYPVQLSKENVQLLAWRYPCINISCNNVDKYLMMAQLILKHTPSTKNIEVSQTTYGGSGLPFSQWYQEKRDEYYTYLQHQHTLATVSQGIFGLDFVLDFEFNTPHVKQVSEEQVPEEIPFHEEKAPIIKSENEDLIVHMFGGTLDMSKYLAKKDTIVTQYMNPLKCARVFMHLFDDTTVGGTFNISGKVTEHSIVQITNSRITNIKGPYDGTILEIDDVSRQFTKKIEGFDIIRGICTPQLGTKNVHIDVRSIPPTLLLLTMHNIFNTPLIESGEPLRAYAKKMTQVIYKCLEGEEVQLPPYLSKEILHDWDAFGVIHSGMFADNCRAHGLSFDLFTVMDCLYN